MRFASVVVVLSITAYHAAAAPRDASSSRADASGSADAGSSSDAADDPGSDFCAREDGQWDDEAYGSSSDFAEHLRNARGRPREHELLKEDLTMYCEAGLTQPEIAEATGAPVRTIQRRIEEHGLQGVAQAARSRMPSHEQLTQWWSDDPSLTTADVHQLGPQRKN